MKFNIKAVGDTCEIIGISSDTVINLNIPAEIDGYKVIKLCDNLFEDSCLMHLTIESPVISIGKATFANSLIETVECKRISSICESAFENSNIKNIYCDELDCIKSNAFKDCPNLNVVSFAKNALKISWDAFSGNNIVLIGKPNSVVETFCQKTGFKFINLNSTGIPDVCPDCGIGWEFKKVPQLHGKCPKCGKRILVEKSGKVIFLNQSNVSL